MKLEPFLRAVGYLYLTDDDFQKTSDLAGIDWNKLPDHLEVVQIIRKYLAKRADSSHKAAQIEMRDDIHYLEIGTEWADIGRSEDELGHQFKKVYSEYSYTKLAEKILANPEKAKQILASFTVGEFTTTESYFVADFMPLLYLERMAQVDKGISRQEIEGFELLSKLIGGFNKKRIIFLEGQTGFGKTVLALNLARNAAMKHKVLYINMEMSLSDMTDRLTVMNSGQSYNDLHKGHIHPSPALDSLEHFGWNLSMTSGRSMTLPAIEALMRRQKIEGLDYVFIDYDLKIDLPSSRNVQEWKQLQQATVHLEDLAKELDICVIMLTQQNRDGQNAGSHRSTFSAHTVLEFRDDPHQGPLIEAKKNRHGKMDHAVKVIYNRESSKITELDVVEITQRPEKKWGR